MNRFAQAADEIEVTVLSGIQHQSLLGKLQLMNEKHQDDGNDQGDEGGVKGNPEVLDNAGNVALKRQMRLAQRALIPRTVPIKPMDGMAQAT